MMQESYEIVLEPVAARDLKSFKHDAGMIVDEILALETSPKKGHELSGSLQGVRALAFSIKGSGQFRVAYLLHEKDRKCIVFAIGPHENFYALAEKRAKPMKRLLEQVIEEKRQSSLKKKPVAPKARKRPQDG